MHRPGRRRPPPGGWRGSSRAPAPGGVEPAPGRGRRARRRDAVVTAQAPGQTCPGGRHGAATGAPASPPGACGVVVSLGVTAAAFFDLDKTVIAKSSTLAFGRPFYRGGLVNRRAVLKSSIAQFVYLLQGADEDSMDRMRDYLKVLCAGWPVEQVNAIVAETLHDLIEPMVYAEAVALFEEHHAAGRDVVIVSSSGEEVVGPDRRDARRRPRHRDADGRRGRQVHRRDRLLRVRRGQGGRDPRAGGASVATTSRSPGRTATPTPTGRCSSWSATRWRSTRTRRCAGTPPSRAGGCASSAGRCGCARGCPACPPRPGRRRRTPGRRSRPAPRAWPGGRGARRAGVTGVTTGS